MLSARVSTVVSPMAFAAASASREIAAVVEAALKHPGLALGRHQGGALGGELARLEQPQSAIERGDGLLLAIELPLRPVQPFE